LEVFDDFDFDHTGATATHYPSSAMLSLQYGDVFCPAWL
jgi:hypothetical protein